jgi:hypothetical protein
MELGDAEAADVFHRVSFVVGDDASFPERFLTILTGAT